MAVRAVAFDVYNTLVRWPADRVRPLEIQQFLQRFGVNISYQAYEAARQGVLFFDSAKRRIEGWTDWLALVFARMGVMVSTDLLADLTALYERRDRMEVLPDAPAAVDAVKAAGKLACAFTTLPEFFVNHGGGEVLRRLDHYFDASATGFAKGDPRFYGRIAELLDVAPGEILAVGDDPICDVQLAREANWQAVLLDRSGTVAPGDDYQTIHSLSDLTRFIR